MMQPLPPPNPLFSRAVQQDTFPTLKQLGWLFLAVSGISVALLFGLYSQPQILTILIGLMLGYLFLLPLLISWRSTYFTEKTIHGGFYDLILADLSDREIVLGHMFIGLYWVREWLIIAVAFILPLIFITPAWVLTQDLSCEEIALSCDESYGSYFILPFHLVFGLIGLNLVASALGVLVSLRWHEKWHVWLYASGGIIVINTIWLLSFYLALRSLQKLDSGDVESFRDYLLGLTLLGSTLLVYLITLRQNYLFIVAIKYGVIALIVMLTILSGLAEFAVLIAILSILGAEFLLYTANSNKDEDSTDVQASSLTYQQVETTFVLAALLLISAGIVVVLLIINNSAWWGLVGLVSLMIFPYLLGIGLMLLAERWTERPLQAGSSEQSLL